MAKHYYVNDNAQANDDHEVHTGECSWLPDIANRTYLGFFNNGIEVVAKAKQQFPNWNINGCYYCSPESNTD